MRLPNAQSAFALQVFEPDSKLVYSIETTSQITHLPRRTIAVCCRRRLVSPVVEPELGGWFFDEEGIRRLRHIERLRDDHGVNLEGIRIIFDLLNELEQLRERLRTLGEYNLEKERHLPRVA